MNCRPAAVASEISGGITSRPRN